MLGRMLRSVLSQRGRGSLHRPTSEQTRLAQQVMAALAASDAAHVSTLLVAMGRAGPPCAEVHRMLGSELGRVGQLDLARTQLETAVALDPSHAGAWTDLGNVHRLSSRFGEAERCYRQALTQDPSAAVVILGLAEMEAAQGRNEAAVERMRALIETNVHPAAVESLTALLDRLDRGEEAKALCIEVLARHPGQGAAHAALGGLLLKREFRPEDALPHFDQAILDGYRTGQLFSNRGIALQDLGRLDEAIASYDEALAVCPGHPLAAFHRSLALLMRGEFGRAWPGYEMRLQSEDRPIAPRLLPNWDGMPTNERLLVYGEQGIGDEIMFASCITDLQRCCPHLTLACTPKLQRLFHRSFPEVEVVTLGEARNPEANAAAGAQRIVPIGSLPLYFRYDRTDFPTHNGYLRADPMLVAEYHERLSELGPGLKIGLSWRGGTYRSRRSLRSVELAELDPLLSMAGVRFVNLQYDSRVDEQGLASEIGAGRIVHWQDALDDYERTAALVASVDCVVSVCTAVIHLAGALGTRTLVLAPFSPEWRYGVAGTDMPWYPSVRVLRQLARHDWRPVIDAVRDEILAGL